MSDFRHRRIDYHRDGTMVLCRTNLDAYPGVELGDTAMEALNSTDGSVARAPAMNNVWTCTYSFFFPYRVHLRGIFTGFMTYRYSNSGGVLSYTAQTPPATAEVSKDSVDPGSGSWLSLGSIGSSVIPPGPQQPGTRPSVDRDGASSQIQSGVALSLGTPSYSAMTGWSGLHGYSRLEWDGTKGVWPVDVRSVRALRVKLSAVSGLSSISAQDVFGNIHLFGDREESYSVDGLEVVPADDGRPPAVRYRDSPVRSSEDKVVRVFNSSLVHTARRIRITCRPGMVASSSPEFVRFLLSFDGQNWFSSLTMDELGPQNFSQPIWVRRITGTTDVQGYGAATVEATAGRWV